jgi:hypothetical protein
MSQTMTCTEYEAMLGRDLEGELSLDERAHADAHLASCPRCATLRVDLVEIAAKAATLPVESPSRDLWSGIAARIEAPVIALGTTGEHRVPRRPHFLRYAAAAAALVAVTAGTTYVLTRNAFLGAEGRAVAGQETPAGPDTLGAATTQLVSDQTAAADAAFDREVTRLRSLLEERRPDLDSATVALLERNLQVIDNAIAESRAALAMDPSSALLNRQLQNALGKKVQVLRTAALLPRGAD